MHARLVDVGHQRILKSRRWQQYQVVGQLATKELRHIICGAGVALLTRLRARRQYQGQTLGSCCVMNVHQGTVPASDRLPRSALPHECGGRKSSVAVCSMIRRQLGISSALVSFLTSRGAPLAAGGAPARSAYIAARCRRRAMSMISGSIVGYILLMLHQY